MPLFKAKLGERDHCHSIRVERRLSKQAISAFIFGGQDSTSHAALCRIFDQLVKFPEVQSKVRDEIRLARVTRRRIRCAGIRLRHTSESPISRRNLQRDNASLPACSHDFSNVCMIC